MTNEVICLIYRPEEDNSDSLRDLVVQEGKDGGVSWEVEKEFEVEEGDGWGDLKGIEVFFSFLFFFGVRN